jgi:hypothetical protein
MSIQDLFCIAKVFTRLCKSFAEQCLEEMKKPVYCKIQAWIVGLQLLKLRALFNRISDELFYSHWKKIDFDFQDSLRKLNKIASRIEILKIKFANIQGEEVVQRLKRKKVLAFLNHVNMSFNDTVFLKYYIQTYNENNIPQHAKRLQKMKKKMIGIFQRKDNWTKPYLRKVKRYKITANVISDCINSVKQQDYE